MTICYLKHITVTSENVEDEYISNADTNNTIIILSSSWESRCLNVLNKARDKYKVGILLNFSEYDNEGEKTKNISTMTDLLTEKCKCVAQIFVDTHNFDVATATMYKEYDRHLDIGSTCIIDMTTIPKYYIFKIIDYLINIVYARKIIVYYSCGYYNKDRSVLTFDPQIFGDYDIEYAEYNSVNVKTSGYEHLIVSLGFHGSENYRLLSKISPAYKTIMLPIPGFISEYEDKVRSENIELITELRNSGDEIIESDAGEVAGTLKRLFSIKGKYANARITYLCTSTKNHTLAMAIDACVNKDSLFIYAIPSMYSMKDVMPTGRIYRHTIVNRSLL